MEDKNHKAAGFGGYFIAWLSLLMLTALTVTVAGMHLRGLSVAAALCIASLKALLVLNIFMHLKSEKPFFKITMIVTVCAIALFIGLTFFDVFFR